MKYDYLIVGQGLAGTLLAAELTVRNKTFILVDDAHRGSSSVIAAGLFTPVTGQRLVLTWRAEEMLRVAGESYRFLEEKHARSFFHPVNTLRIFRNDDEVALWSQKQDDPVLQPYLASRHLPESCSAHAPLGGFELQGSGWVNLNELMKIIPLDAIRNERFDHSECEVSADRVRWKDVEACELVFCEGYQAANNPWFERLTFRNAHGEVLTIRVPALAQTHVVNSGIFLLPLGDHLFRVGATYGWDAVQPQTTDAGKQELLEKVRGLIPHEVEVVDHRAGIRPIATQRVPVLGRHPEMPRVSIFNGLGSKGVLYAPFFARQLIEHLEGDNDLDPEVRLTKRIK
jgi:glycine/D-amino acid oxidase-like deaminating enzyme